jgi:hypothetical protein
LQKQAGVSDATVNLMMGNATVTFDPAVVSAEALVTAIRDTGYGAEIPVEERSAFEEQEARDAATAAEFEELRLKAIVSGAIGAAAMAAMPWMHHYPWAPWALLVLTTGVMLTAGRHFYTRAWSSFRHHSAGHEHADLGGHRSGVPLLGDRDGVAGVLHLARRGRRRLLRSRHPHHGVHPHGERVRGAGQAQHGRRAPGARAPATQDGARGAQRRGARRRSSGVEGEW